MLHPTQGSREVIPSSDREMFTDIVAHGTQEGVKGGRRGANSAFKGPQLTAMTVSQAVPVGDTP
jgi:hypothetical protein